MSAGVHLCCACVLENGEEQSLGKGRAGRRWCPGGTDGICIKSQISEGFIGTLCLVGRF